ncbi:MAG: hypothetical protein KDA45_13785, partial [Planctomycetales bacterium]|nr:hypothetical protein [Planctomycetales bacterium]
MMDWWTCNWLRTRLAGVASAATPTGDGLPGPGRPGHWLVVAVVCTVVCSGWSASATASSSPSESTTGAEARLNASLSADSVQVAQPFDLELQVTAPAGAKVVFPAASGQLGEFQVLDHQDVFDIPLDIRGYRSWTRRYTLESIFSGELTIPALEVLVVGPGGRQTLRSTALPLRVASVLEGQSDPTKFRDIQSVVDVAVPPTESPNWSQKKFLGWALLGGGALLAIAAVALVARKRRYLTPRDWALQQLA